MKRLRKKVLLKTDIKKFQGLPVTGPILIELASAYSERLNKGEVPQIESAWNNIVTNSCRNSMKEGIRSFEKEVKETITLPAEENALSSALDSLKKDQERKFRESCIGNQDDVNFHMQEFTKKIDEIISLILTENRSKIESAVETFIKNEYIEKIDKRLKRQEIGSFKEFGDQIDALTDLFKHQFKLESLNSPHLTTFKSKMFSFVLKAGLYLDSHANQAWKIEK